MRAVDMIRFPIFAGRDFDLDYLKFFPNQVR